MKFSPTVVVFLALALFNTAHAATPGVYIEYQDGEWMYVDMKKYGSGQKNDQKNDRTDIIIDEPASNRPMCTIFRPEDQSMVMAECKAIFQAFKDVHTKMMRQAGITKADIPKNKTKGSSKVRKIAGKIIAGQPSDCYEFGHYFQRIVCIAPQVNTLIAAMGVDRRKWDEKFQMGERPDRDLAFAKLEDKGFVMSDVNILTAMGISRLVFEHLPDEKKREMVNEARQNLEKNGGPMPGTLVKRIEKITKKLNRHLSFNKLTIDEFIASGMGGGDMSTSDVQTGMGGGVNLQEILKQQGITNTDVTTTTKKSKKNKKDKKKKGDWLKKARDKAKAILNPGE